jgi:hypothetical protein
VSNLYHIAFGKGLVNLCVCIIWQIIYKSFTAIVGIQSPIGVGWTTSEKNERKDGVQPWEQEDNLCPVGNVMVK